MSSLTLRAKLCVCVYVCVCVCEKKREIVCVCGCVEDKPAARELLLKGKAQYG